MNNSATTQTAIERAKIAFEERIGITFTPDEKFYKKVGINQKRFGMLTRGDQQVQQKQLLAFMEER